MDSRFTQALWSIMEIERARVGVNGTETKMRNQSAVYASLMEIERSRVDLKMARLKYVTSQRFTQALWKYNVQVDLYFVNT